MAGVDGFFEAAVCGDEVAHAKPAPDTFLAAAKALGVPAEECLVLEDRNISKLNGSSVYWGCSVTVPAPL